MKLEVTMKQSLPGLLGVVVLAATPLLAEERMNFAFGFPATSAVGLAVEDYIAAAAERSDGEIVITGFPSTLSHPVLFYPLFLYSPSLSLFLTLQLFPLFFPSLAPSTLLSLYLFLSAFHSLYFLSVSFSLFSLHVFR